MFDFLHIRRNHLPELFWHTDVHSHVCPGIDDGSPTPERSVKLVEAMGELGFKRMIVTPHVTDEVFPNTIPIIAESFSLLTDGCKQAGIDMQLDYSAEYRIDELLTKYLKDGQVRSLPGGYLLVENPWLQEPTGLERTLFEIRSTYGLKPILAHPERYSYYQRDRRRYEQLHAKGIMFQVNLMSLAGSYDKACKNTAEWLLEKGLVDFVGSDVHRMTHVENIRRYLTSRDYRKLEAAARHIKNDTLTAEAVVNG